MAMKETSIGIGSLTFVNKDSKIMNDKNSFKGEEIKRLLIECARLGANHALERSGAISPFISRSEIVKMIGRGKYDTAVKDGELSILKGEGVNGTILCPRADFERYLLKTIRIDFSIDEPSQNQ